MAGNVTVKMKGVDALIGRFRELKTEKEVASISYSGTSRPAKEVMKYARANALTYRVMDTGETIRNIARKKIRVGTWRGYTISVRANQSKRAKAGKNGNPYYWWIVHFGLKKGTAPRPWLQNAFVQYRAKAKNDITSQVFKAVDAAAKRALKKRGAA